MSDSPLLGLFKPLPKQIDFLKAALKFRFLLFGGARGPGKSYILRWGLLWMLIRWYQKHGLENVRVGLFCEDYPTLRDRQISKIKMEFPSWLGEVKSTQAEGLGFFLRPEYGGGAILLRNLDDPSKYMSAEFAGIGVDELTKHEISTFDVLRGSLRWPGINRPFFWGATNPGGVGHLWCKSLWIDNNFGGDFERLQILQDQFCYIKALPSDNHHLTPEYWLELESQPEAVRRAWIHGEWDAFEGMFFSEWTNDAHVVPVEDHAKILVDPWWELMGGMDWGYDPHPGIFGAAAFDPFGRAWGYKEWKFNRMSGRAVGEHLATQVLKSDAERKIIIQGDTQMWTTQPDRGVSIADDINDALADAGCEAVLVQANKDRINGWMRVHQWLDPRRPNPEGKGTAPFLRFLAYDQNTGIGCPYTISTLPVQTHDEKKPGDLLKSSHDHAADMWRYLFMAREPLSTVPLMLQPAKTHRERLQEKTKEIMEKAYKRSKEREEAAAYVDESMLPDDLQGENWEEFWS